MDTRITAVTGALALAALAAFGCQKTDKSAGGCASGVCAPKSTATAPATTTAPVKAGPAEMNTAALLAMQRAGLKLQLLEARPGVKELIPGAKPVPFDATDQDLAATLPDKDALYVTYCGGPKCGASARLAGRLAGLGYRRVIEFRDGWAGWSDAQAGKELPRAELSAAALKVLIEGGADLKIFDARTGKYDDGRRVPGAGSLSAQSTPEEVAKVLPRKDQLVVTYCANLKCPASDLLARHLAKLGYTSVVEFPAGIEGWAEAGYAAKAPEAAAK